MSECMFWDDECLWWMESDTPCEFLVNGKCTAKDEDLVTEEEYEESIDEVCELNKNKK